MGGGGIGCRLIIWPEEYTGDADSHEARGQRTENAV